MRNEKNSDFAKGGVSRRTFLGTTAALAVSSMMPVRAWGADCRSKPNSKFNGVQIGAITYSFRSKPCSAEDILKYAQQTGLSSLELMGGAAEGYAKAHAGSDPMDGFRALRKLYNDAGVNIHIVKFGNVGDSKMSDEQIEYYFEAAKACGAMGITREMSDSAGKRLGPIADKHKI